MAVCKNCGEPTIITDLCEICGNPKFKTLQAENKRLKGFIETLKPLPPDAFEQYRKALRETQ